MKSIQQHFKPIFGVRTGLFYIIPWSSLSYILQATPSIHFRNISQHGNFFSNIFNEDTQRRELESAGRSFFLRFSNNSNSFLQYLPTNIPSSWQDTESLDFSIKDETLFVYHSTTDSKLDPEFEELKDYTFESSVSCPSLFLNRF